MGLYRDESGLVFEIDDAAAQARGYTPVSSAEEQQIYSERGLENRADTGIGGALNAAGSRLLGGASLGLTDVLKDYVATPAEREQLLRDIKAHPIASTAAEITGAVLPTLAGGPLSKTPSGYLSSIANRELEHGLERGGVAGTAQALNAMGTEGAIQSAGQYIGHSAIEDKEVTAEGLAGALGAGYAFGTVAGGAGLGITNGTIAARRLYSRWADGPKAAKDAESAWSLASEEALAGEQATTKALQDRLDEIQSAKTEAMRHRNEARAATQEERIRASAASEPPAGAPLAPEEPVGPSPLDEGIAPAQGGERTSVFTRPEAPSREAAAAFDASLPSDQAAVQEIADTVPPVQGEVTSVRKMPKGKKATPALPRTAADVTDEAITTVPARDIRAHGFESDSTPGRDAVKTDKARTAIKEGQREPIKISVSPNGKYQIEDGTHRLAAAIEQGADVKVQWYRGAKGLDEAPASKYVVKGEPASILEQKLAGTKAQLEEGTPLKDIAPSKGNASNSIEQWLNEKKLSDAALHEQRRLDLQGLRGEALSEMRHASTSDLLSPAIADEEAKIVQALDEVKAAREAMQRIDSGITAEQLASFRADNPTRVGKPNPREQAMEVLDKAHEDALMNAQVLADPHEAGAWLKKAQEVEDLMMSLPHEKDIYWNLGDSISVVSRYEKAVAKAADVAGEGAHPAARKLADDLAQAERDADRKLMERTTRAVDDAAEGPPYKTPKERVQYARERQLEAQRKLDEVSLREKETQLQLDKAKRKQRESEGAKRAALKQDAKAAREAQAEGPVKSKHIPEVLGAMEMLGLPGMPKAEDLPVVGPLLSTWLKYRTLKAALGRKMGRVAATGDARAAAVASRTRDRIARAVDRSLGLAEKGGRVATKYAPAAAGVLASRIYDDGMPDAPKGAPIQTLAATRIRELAAYVSTPNAIERDVRAQLTDVMDPDLIAAAEKQRRAMFEYLLANAPKAPEQGIMKTINWQPSPAEAMSFARRFEAAADPAGIWERIAEQHAMITLEAGDALRKVYPALFAQAQQRVLERVAETGTTVPYRARVQMSLLYQLPLDASLESGNIRITQSVYDRKMVPPPGAPTPPTPSIANGTNLTALFQTPADRNALRR